MRVVNKDTIPRIAAAYLLLAVMFVFFAWRGWPLFGLDGCTDLAVASFGVFGFMIPALGPDLKNHKVFIVLAGLMVAHFAFCAHFLERGVHVRAILYAPVGILEIAVGTFALILLGGARLDAFRDDPGPKGRN